MSSETDLIDACSEGKVNAVREILGSHQSLSEVDLEDSMHEAAHGGHSEVVRELLDYGAPVTELAVLGATYSLSVPILQHLIDHGWDVNSLVPEGPALRLVVESEDCARLLLKHGADPNAAGRRGFTPLSTAIGNAPVAVMELLLESGARMPSHRDLLFDAIQREKEALGATQFLLEHGIDPNVSTSKGPPLHCAVGMGRKEIVRCLLRYGADPSRVFLGRTAAQLAEDRGKTDLVSMLASVN